MSTVQPKAITITHPAATPGKTDWKTILALCLAIFDMAEPLIVTVIPPQDATIVGEAGQIANQAIPIVIQATTPSA